MCQFALVLCARLPWLGLKGRDGEVGWEALIARLEAFDLDGREKVDGKEGLCRWEVERGSMDLDLPMFLLWYRKATTFCYFKTNKKKNKKLNRARQREVRVFNEVDLEFCYFKTNKQTKISHLRLLHLG